MGGCVATGIDVVTMAAEGGVGTRDYATVPTRDENINRESMVKYTDSERKNIEEPIPGFIIRITKRSLVKKIVKTISFRQPICCLRRINNTW